MTAESRLSNAVAHRPRVSLMRTEHSFDMVVVRDSADTFVADRFRSPPKVEQLVAFGNTAPAMNVYVSVVWWCGGESRLLLRRLSYRLSATKSVLS
jgi:hypothetical protein